MPRHLILRLEGPLVAFGDVMIDAVGPVRDTPSTSSLTGLLGNALGVRREESRRLARLQERLVFGCRMDRQGSRFTEFQTARLGRGDVGWTTRGRPEGRAGGPKKYHSPHLRRRAHDADVRVTVALRLEPAEEAPDVDALARALDEPARPLFLGRKACLPATPLFFGWRDAPTVLDALRAVPLARPRRAERSAVDSGVLVTLPTDEPPPTGFRPVHTCDRRDWVAGVHAGESTLYVGRQAWDDFPTDLEPRA